MFGWLKRGKPAHPMANPEHVQELIASLSASDPAKALERISGRLESRMRRAPELPLRWRDPVDPLRPALGETLAGGRSARLRSGWRRSAVLLAAAPDESDEAVVVMPAGLMEGGEDFDCARFRVLRS
jgi:hypothetical protein